MASLVELARTGELVRDTLHTLGVTLTAAGMTSALGAAVGLAVGLLPTLRDYVVASIDFLRTIPAVTLIPVAVLTFGPVPTTELMLAVYAALWPVVLLRRRRRRCTPTSVRHRANAAFLPRHDRSKDRASRGCAGMAGRCAFGRGHRAACRARRGNDHVPARAGRGSDRVAQRAGARAHVGICARVRCHRIRLNAVLRRAVCLVIPGSPANADGDVTVSVEPVVTQPATRARGLLPLAAMLVTWQLAATSDSLFFPPPSEWLKALGRLFDGGVLTPAVAQTVSTYALGLSFAVAIGALVGVAIGASRRIDRAFTPSIDFLAAIPGAAVVPVVVLLLGPNQLSGVVVVALIVSWPILLATAMAMRTVPAVRIEMSRTLGLTLMQRWTKVIVPSLTPGVILGVRVASAMALIVTLLVDIFGVESGLGRLLIESQQRFEAGTAWGLLAMVGSFGYLTSVLFAWAGRVSGNPR